ncbi:MAG: sigma 54-interacting transcriptional regulator, partial [Syntrophaceae bacterium]|nr:sigma 54-interacting transcriptional regulator [Syntrophaceae bacterium]
MNNGKVFFADHSGSNPEPPADAVPEQGHEIQSIRNGRNESFKEEEKHAEQVFDTMIGCSEVMKMVFKMIKKVSASESTVLITGESGTGKELVAQAIHAHSPRSHQPLIPVNCGAIPEDLLESELFGHEKGAFTGAIRSRLGRFELA